MTNLKGIQTIPKKLIKLVDKPNETFQRKNSQFSKPFQSPRKEADSSPRNQNEKNKSLYSKPFSRNPNIKVS